MTLKYPMNAGGGDSDYVSFRPLQYRSNASGGAAAPSSGAESIILYMPNSTPGLDNGQQWGDTANQFAGPAGAAKKTAFAGLGKTGAGLMGGGSFPQAGQDLAAAVKAGAKGMLTKGAITQALMSKVATDMRSSANQILALNGKLLNPNVELLYQSPSMRSFGMAFDFIPKNSQEAQMVNRIIMNFKKWSAPADLENGMFEVPHVWQVTYMTGGSENKNMNKFKKAACVGIEVKANDGTDMHVAHDGGVPIITTMSLQFQEVDIITRQDHEKVGGQGY